jgi:hypothetical protein
LQLSQNAKESDVPQGAQVHNLSDIAEQQGLPASFAGPWPVAESTNVMAKPANEGTPANAPAQNPNPPASKNHAPVNPSTTNSSTTNSSTTNSSTTN